MTRLLFYCPLLVVLALVMPAPALSGLHQDLVVTLDPATRSLDVQATLRQTEGTAGWPAVLLLASSAQITSLSADETPLPIDFSGGRLSIARVSKARQLQLAYRVAFADPVPQDPVGIEDPSYGVSATIGPKGAFLSAGSFWHPIVPAGESLFTVTISASGGLTGVTAGRLLDYDVDGDRVLTRWQTTLPQSSLALAAGHYRLQQDRLDGIQLLTFMSERNAPLASGYLASVREYLAVYQDLFGPYPYEKFAVVENFYPTGYGLPGWTLLGSNVIRLPFIRTTSLPHEIAHAWWGNAVSIDYSSGNWGEGLATYVADYYLKERSDPQAALEYRRKILRDYASLIGPQDDMPLVDFRGRMSKRDQAIGYGKAAMVFHMLRNRIGDAAFWQALQAIAHDGRGQRYGWKDLQRHFQNVANEDLTPFFRQWLERSGAPRLQLAETGFKRVADGWQVSGTVRQGKPVYALDAPLELVTEQQVYHQIVALDSTESTFVFTVAERPVSLSVDPENHLFRQLYPEERPATVNDLRASRRPLVVVSRGADRLLAASRDLLRGLQWQDAEVLDEAGILAAMPTDRDVLFLGWPQSARLQPQKTAEVSALLPEQPVDGKLNLDPNRVLFLVQKPPGQDRVKAYFLPGSSEAAVDTARRIPHYGRYSYLVFEAGRNQIKATWEPRGSPLQVNFEEEPK
jgi:aminopeptidase N